MSDTITRYVSYDEGLFIINIEEDQQAADERFYQLSLSTMSSMQEDFGRRKRIKRITNFLGASSVIDAVATVVLLVLLMRADDLSKYSVLVACIQISNHEFLVLISSVILIRCGNQHYDRIDACGAWMIIHFLVIIGNGSFLAFEYLEDNDIIFNASLYKKILLAWKAYFILLELFGMLYCFYIVHKPVAHMTPKGQRTPHPLFNQTLERNTLEGVAPRDTSAVQMRHRPRSAVFSHENFPNGGGGASSYPIDNLRNQTNSGYNRNSCYESYQSLTIIGTDTPLKYRRNPAYESELSLDYANHYSPYDHMIMTNRNRLSYVEPISETGEMRIDYDAIGRD